MTNKTEMVSVPRELLVSLCNFHAFGWEDLGPEFAALRALLAAPAEGVRAVGEEPVAFNDPLYNAESDARNAAAMLEEVLEWFDDGVGRSPEEHKLLMKIRRWLNP